MSNEEPDEHIARLLRELADERERRLPPQPLSGFDRNVLLKEVRRTLVQPPPRRSSWGLWRVRFWPAIGIGTVAAAAAVALLLIAKGPGKGSGGGGSGRVELAVQWPATGPFDSSARKAWRSVQAPLAKDLPDFGSSTGTLGGSSDDQHARWGLATVILRSESGLGSGAFISADGWLLSAYHVVADAAQQAAAEGRPGAVQVIMAQMTGGRLEPREPPLRATLYRADPRLDLALLKLEPLPAGIGSLPCFPLADQVQPGEECFAVGSEPGGPAWRVRSGNTAPEFDYPQGLGRLASDAADALAGLERTRATMIVSDAGISPGDAGGPLLNAKGQLIGLTFGAATNLGGSPVGWHVALKHLRAFAADLPARPEGIPLDPLTAGLPSAEMLEPELADGDRDGRIDSLLYRYVAIEKDKLGGARAQPLALTIFVDFSQRTPRTADPLARVPAGLWGMEDRGRFHFDLFLLSRADGVTAVGYVNGQGVVDEIRVGRSHESATRVLWRRDAVGKWQCSSPTAPSPLLDATRLRPGDLTRLRAIAGDVLAASAQPPGQAAAPAKRGP